MRVAVLTSSRADFGIYLPLLKELKEDPAVDLEIIAFGTHLSHFHGYTLNAITEHDFVVLHKIESLILGDSEEAVSASIGLTVLKFSSFWSLHSDYDLVFCLGDRYEMFAAVMAAIPFGIRFAHIHGGETTLGAVDNIFRHAITQASQIHFTSTETHASRVREMTGSLNVYNVGALSLDNLTAIELYRNQDFLAIWGIDLSQPTILVTYHPETVQPSVNEKYANELSYALKTLSNEYQVVVTMPNADTQGSLVRSILEKQLCGSSNVYLVENFGTRGYFTIMKRCSFLIGNTSSGIIEAASFSKYVINLGDRQKGRLAGENVFHVPAVAEKIVDSVKTIEVLPEWAGGNIYAQGGATERILKVIKGNGL